jgi:hypothetical protein
MTDSGYRRMFQFGAFWNLSGAVVVWFGAGLVFGMAGMPTPEPVAFYDAWIALFATYGFGVYLISRDMYGNLSLVRLGIVGKVSFAVIFVYYYGRGALIPPFFWLAVVGDLIFAAFFAAFLRHAARRG